jgi:hypothetical protein
MPRTLEAMTLAWGAKARSGMRHLNLFFFRPLTVEEGFLRPDR